MEQCVCRESFEDWTNGTWVCHLCFCEDKLKECVCADRDTPLNDDLSIEQKCKNIFWDLRENGIK